MIKRCYGEVIHTEHLENEPEKKTYDHMHAQIRYDYGDDQWYEMCPESALG